jgi:hypothetical protein
MKLWIELDKIINHWLYCCNTLEELMLKWNEITWKVASM